MADGEEDEKPGAILRVDEDEPPDVEMTDDGGAVVSIEEETQEVEEVESFYANIVTQFDEQTLDSLQMELVEATDRDKQARKEADKMYAEAIKRTGLGKEAPGGAQFQGASRAVHPMLLEAAIDFASRAIRELMPPGGPVKIFIPGDTADPARLKKAQRKKNYLNWQFLFQMQEFRSELEQLLTQLSLGGSMYLRIIPDFSKRRKRPVPTFVPLDYVTIPSSAANYYTAERQCYWEPVTDEEFKARVRDGMYVEPTNFIKPSQKPVETESEKASDKVEGVQPDPQNDDGTRIVREISVLKDIGDNDYGVAPYLISIDETSRKVVSIVRNWDKDDEMFDRMQWMVEWIFFPWRGAKGIGLGQAVGSLAGAATGALRALLDSGHINNIPTLARLKGANFVGQSKTINATQVVDIEGGVAADQDIRKLLMNIPFNEPSQVLFQLLGFLTDAGRQTIHVALDKLAEDNKNLPVGTTLALIEEGMKVMSAIHLRMFHSMTQTINIVHRIDRMYLTEDELKNDTGEVLARKADFDGPLDCIPTADPEIFSDVQRIAQAQILADRAASLPDLYNQRETELFLLERSKIPSPERFLKPEPKPEEMNQVNENVAMSLGRPVTAFPEQDHQAHLQVLVDFMMSPIFGSNPIIAPNFLGAALQHMKEHLVLWYANDYYEITKSVLEPEGVDMSMVMKEKDPDTRKELDQTLATASPLVGKRSMTVFKDLPQVIQQAQQLLQQFQQPPQLPVDPNKMAEVQRKAQADQQHGQLAREKMQGEQQGKVIDLQFKREERQGITELEFAKLSAKEREVALAEAHENARVAQQLAARLDEINVQERAESERAGAERLSMEQRNTQDNLTALKVAAAEIESKEKVDRSTGTGTNKNPSGGRPRG